MDPANPGTPVSAYVSLHPVHSGGVPAPRHMGVIADTLRQSLRQMAESDARLYRGLAAELEGAAPAPALPATTAEIAAAIALLERHGFTVTR